MGLPPFHQHPLDIAPEEIAHQLQWPVQVLMQQGGCHDLPATLLDFGPEFRQVSHVLRQRLGRLPGCRGAHDEAFLPLPLTHHRVAKLIPLLLVGNLAADPHVIRQRHHDQVAAGQRQTAGDTGTFAGDGLLDHLHQQGVPLPHQILDAGALAGGLGLRRKQEVGHMEKSVPVQPDIHESRLHTGQHPVDPPLVDVADARPVRLPLHRHFHDAAPLQESHPRLKGIGADKDFPVHLQPRETTSRGDRTFSPRATNCSSRVTGTSVPGRS